MTHYIKMRGKNESPSGDCGSGSQAGDSFCFVFRSQMRIAQGHLAVRVPK